MRNLVKYGTYGFLSALVAAQMAMTPALGSDQTDKTALDARKSARAAKRDLKKTGRKITGNSNAWDDTRDEAHTAIDNAKDEGQYQKKKAEKK